MLLFEEGSGFVVTRNVPAQHIDDSIGVLEISARVHIVDEEPELDGWHTVANEDVLVSSVFCFHCLESFLRSSFVLVMSASQTHTAMPPFWSTQSMSLPISS